MTDITHLILQVQILKAIPQIEEIYMAFPNKHYFSVDLSKFPKSVGGADRNDEVFLPVDKPSGYITSTMGRKDLRAIVCMLF